LVFPAGCAAPEAARPRAETARRDALLTA